MSVHLKEGLPPFAKRGKPGTFELTKLEDKILTREYLHNIATQILERSKFLILAILKFLKQAHL
jgi:ATPase